VVFAFGIVKEKLLLIAVKYNELTAVASKKMSYDTALNAVSYPLPVYDTPLNCSAQISVSSLHLKT
jgi:hypothetical protein